MNDLMLALAKDLPSTAVLLLFLWQTGKQFDRLTSALENHLAELSRLLGDCIKSDNSVTER